MSIVASPPFQLHVRTVFIVVSSLSILWTYLLVLHWRRNSVEAFVACCILGLSWEYTYHLRWIAPDAIMAQFGALSILLLFVGRTSEQPMRWLRFSAIAAGLAGATKYPGGLVLLPVLLGAFLLGTASLMFRLRALCEICFAACLTYLFASPGSLLDLYASVEHIKYEINHYATGHWGYTVSSPVQHLQLMMAYFIFAAFSPHSIIAVSFFITSIIGGYALVREKPPVAVLFLSLPVVYIMYLSIQNVMIVRNLLIMFPFFAILSARGIMCLKSKYASQRISGAIFAGLVAGLLLINAGWAISSTYSITHKNRTDYIEQVTDYVAQRSHTTFWVSEPVYQAMVHVGRQLPSNLTNSMHKADTVIFYSYEVGEYEWQANRYNYTLTWFGPYEVNFNYYPSWTGDKRIVMMPVHHALRIPSLATSSS